MSDLSKIAGELRRSAAEMRGAGAEFDLAQRIVRAVADEIQRGGPGSGRHKGGGVKTDAHSDRLSSAIDAAADARDRVGAVISDGPSGAGKREQNRYEDRMNAANARAGDAADAVREAFLAHPDRAAAQKIAEAKWEENSVDENYGEPGGDHLHDALLSVHPKING